VLRTKGWDVASLPESVVLLLVALVLLLVVVQAAMLVRFLDLKGTESCSQPPYLLRQPCAILAFQCQRTTLLVEGVHHLPYYCPWMCLPRCRYCFELCFQARAVQVQKGVREVFRGRELAERFQWVVHLGRLRLFLLLVLNGR